MAGSKNFVFFGLFVGDGGRLGDGGVGVWWMMDNGWVDGWRMVGSREDGGFFVLCMDGWMDAWRGMGLVSWSLGRWWERKWYCDSRG